jgi:hypothetical protein
MYFHTNCISRINNAMKKVINRGPRYDFKIKESSFFIGKLPGFAKINNNAKVIIVFLWRA